MAAPARLAGAFQSFFRWSRRLVTPELQLLRPVCSLLSKVADGKPNYKLIKKQALASKPPCGENLAGIYAFALKPHVSMILIMVRIFYLKI